MDFHCVCIVGGTGSLGHALTQFFLAQTEATVRIVSRDEFKQAEMQKVFGEDRVRYFLGDIRDKGRLHLAFYQCDLVINAAALKQVPAGEYNPSEFVRTNVYGTENVIEACRTMDVPRAVFISSDKAVHPLNTYGFCKGLSERLWIRANGYSPEGTSYLTVRYGNVSGSRSSVICVWRDALARGEQPGITDPAMTRFHLTLDEAVQLVWFAAQHAPRGSILVPHVPAYRVVDLYKAVCGEVSYKVIGKRPGEKLHEELMTEEEMAKAWAYTSWVAPSTTYYGIPPVAPSWAFPDPSTSMTPVAWGVEQAHPAAYRSDSWPWRLTAEELRTQLGEQPCVS